MNTDTPKISTIEDTDTLNPAAAAAVPLTAQTQALSSPPGDLPLADDPDPDLLAAYQAEMDSPPPSVPLRARRLEIKARTGSFLHRLTEEQRRQLFVWLAEHSVPRVAEIVAQPPPVGFGLKVQATTLRRLRAMMATMQTEDDFENSALAADSLSEAIDGHRVDFAPVIGDLLFQKTFDLARQGASSASELKELIASFVKLRELELKAHRLRLDSARERSGPSPRRHQVDLNIIPPPRSPMTSPAHVPQVIQVIPPAPAQISDSSGAGESPIPSQPPK